MSLFSIATIIIKIFTDDRVSNLFLSSLFRLLVISTMNFQNKICCFYFIQPCISQLRDELLKTALVIGWFLWGIATLSLSPPLTQIIDLSLKGTAEPWLLQNNEYNREIILIVGKVCSLGRCCIHLKYWKETSPTFPKSQRSVMAFNVEKAGITTKRST